jgi:ABC-2 type transport system ATP-binding protein
MTIEVNNLFKKYGSTVAVDIPSLNIGNGEIVGLVGNNGAGKTTFFRLLLDLIQAGRGQVLVNGMDVAASEEWKQFSGSFLDNSFLVECLTAEEYFTFTGQAYGLNLGEVKSRLALFSRFMNGEILGKEKYIRDYSSGNKQKTGITGAMMVHPQLLILDEPFNFLDPSSQEEIKRLIRELNQERGTTILLSSHNLNHIYDISTRILLMEKGEIRKDLTNTGKESLAELEQFFHIN